MSPGRTAAVVATTLMLQVCLFARFSYEGARPDLMILLAVLAGYRLGAERGAIVGFAAGLSFDVLLTTPFGLSALTYTVVGYATGVVTSGVLRTARWITPVVAAVGTAAGTFLYAVFGAVLGEPTFEGASIAAILVYVAAINAVLAPLASRALTWVRTDERDRRQTFFAR